ncbi:MAG: hypothetical protein AB8B50_03135 [Pirellulaceae bacterium]
MTTLKESKVLASNSRDLVSLCLLTIAAVATAGSYFAMLDSANTIGIAFPAIVMVAVVLWCSLLYLSRQLSPARVRGWQLASLIVCLAALGVGFLIQSALPISVAVVGSMLALFGSLKSTKHKSSISGFAALVVIVFIPLTTNVWFQEWVMRFMKNAIHFGLRAIEVPNAAFAHVIAVEDRQIVLSDLANSPSLIWGVVLAGVFTLFAMRGVTHAICNLAVAYFCAVLAECARVILFEYSSLGSVEPVSETVVAVIAYVVAALVFLSLEQMLRVVFHPIGVGFVNNQANPIAAVWNKLVKGMRDSQDQYDWWRNEGGQAAKGNLVLRVLAGGLCVLVTIAAPSLAFSKLKQERFDTEKLGLQIQSRLSAEAAANLAIPASKAMQAATEVDLTTDEQRLAGVAISHLEATESGELSVLAGAVPEPQLIAFSRLRGWDKPAAFINAAESMQNPDSTVKTGKTMAIYGYICSADVGLIAAPSNASTCLSIVWNREWLREPSPEELSTCYDEFSAVAQQIGKAIFQP